MAAQNEPRLEDNRRTFLKKCGTFALVTPPAVTFLLSTSMSSKAIAASSGRGRDSNALFGVLGAGAGVGAGALGAGALVPVGQVASAPLAAVPQAVVAPVAAPPPPMEPPPPATYSVAGERG